MQPRPGRVEFTIFVLLGFFEFVISGSSRHGWEQLRIGSGDEVAFFLRCDESFISHVINVLLYIVSGVFGS